MPPVSTTLAKLVAKFATGVVDTGGKFAVGIVDDDFLEQLRQSMTQFVPPAVRPVAEAEPSKMEADLQKASFVYVRRGATSSALSPLYQGHYSVKNG